MFFDPKILPTKKRAALHAWVFRNSAKSIHKNKHSSCRAVHHLQATSKARNLKKQQLD